MLDVPSNASYQLGLTLSGHNFVWPVRYPSGIVFAPEGETVNIGTIKTTTAGALSVSAMRQRGTDDGDATNGDETQTWTPDISVTFTADDEITGDDYGTATYAVWHDGTAGADSTAAGGTLTEGAGDAEGTWTLTGFTSPSDGAFNVWVVATAPYTGTASPAPPALVISSARDGVAAVDPSASGVTTRRQATATATAAAATGNFIQASWTATTNGSSSFRLVAQVTAEDFGASPVWVVLAVDPALTSTSRSAVSVEIGDDYTVEASVATPSGTGSVGTVTAADLRKAISIAVESVQGTADATDDGPKWKRSAAVSLAARTSGS